MISAYFASSMIYMIIILCATYMFVDGIRANGWYNIVKKKDKKRLTSIIAVSMIPVLRLGVILMLFYMSVTPKGIFDRWRDSFKKED